MKFYKSKSLWFIAVAAGLTFTFYPHQTKRRPASVGPFTPNPALELGESWTAQDVANAERILEISENTLTKKTNGAPLMRRDAHPKHHGCVKAYFETDTKNLPTSQHVGVFSDNRPKKYEAWIRYSNGNPNVKADKDGDVRGMAMKLINVPGTNVGSQDFLLMNSKPFFIKDAGQYVDFMEATEGNFSLLWYLGLHARTRNVILAAQNMKVGNPLHIDYYSATPYKLGNKAVKYSARTCTPAEQRDSVPSDATPNFLSEHLENTITKKESCFDFYVQINTDPSKLPVEDATVEWDESIAPFVKIGRITIPVQEKINTQERKNFCENLSFDPWHTLPEQRPIGAINRVRLLVYSAISKMRHSYNNIAQIEPTDLNACTGKTESLCK